MNDVPDLHSRAKVGRPRCPTRKSTVGIRILDAKRKHGFRQLPSACGDGQVVSIDLPLDIHYDELVNFVTSKLFPEGVNDVAGNICEYNVSLVNAANSVLDIWRVVNEMMVF